ncbi:MAG: SusE domain-containing protein [Bacteroides sp.]|nr:SusE domain-containing protein [Bacteroides sp.]
MKKIYSALLMFLLGFITFSCSEDKDPVFNEADAVASKLTAISEAYVLDAATSDFATFSYTAADFGLNVSLLYSLEASLSPDFKDSKELASADDATKGLEVTAEKMNSMLLSWDVEAETPTVVYFRVKAFVQDLSSKQTAMVVYSNQITSTISAYDGEKEYPKIWVIGDYCGWSHGDSQFLFCFEEDDVKYQGLVDFGEKAEGGFKLSDAADWDHGNWGVDGNAAAPEAEAGSIQLINSPSSGNISCYSSHRFYHLSFDKTTLMLTKDMSFDAISIVGDAGSQVAGWGGSEVDLQFDAAKQRFWADVEFAAGEIKFRLDNDWGSSWGSITAPGVLDTVDGNNIEVTAGKYRVYVNMNNTGSMTYELSEKDFGK